SFLPLRLLPQGSWGFYVRAYCASLPPHTPDMLTVRIQAIDGTGTFTLPDFQPCRLLIPCSGDFSSGARRASPVTQCVLITVLSLPPRRGEGAASVRFRHPMLPSPLRCELGPRVWHFRAHICVHCRYGPVTRSLPMDHRV